jgi:anti-sigma regulatory factor (Ser/Thr protein kinase)
VVGLAGRSPRVDVLQLAQREARLCAARVAGRTAEIEVTREVGSAARARSFVAATLDGWECRDPDEVITLMTSELVTNAVRYADAPFFVGITRTDEHTVRVHVTDGSPFSPVAPHSVPDHEGGRGLRIVDVLARRWGTQRCERQKSVWFEAAVVHRPVSCLDDR